MKSTNGEEKSVRDKPPQIPDNSPEEELEAERALSEDQDTWEASPLTRPIRVGRPAGRTKQQVTVRLDHDLIRALKTPDAKGWQTRLNAAARAGLKLD